jgi:hypothetical protein
MTEPYVDDSLFDWREPESEYADESLMPEPRSHFMATCPECATLTTHAEFSDEDGANRLQACVVCRRIVRREQ